MKSNPSFFNEEFQIMASLILRMNEGDSAVDRGANGLHNDTGYAIVTESYLNAHTDESKLSEIKKGETLIIHGHGSTTRLGRKTAVEMAAFLAENGLTGPVEILLYACKGGMTGAPFALELKVALVQGHKIMCSVQGMKGNLQRNRTTGAWSVATQAGNVSCKQGSYQTTKCF
jgi:hypothetical protein